MTRIHTTLALATLAALGLAPAQGHTYDLTQSFADQNGGPALNPNGGTRTSAGYAFGADQGPTLTGALDSLSTYTIDFTVSLNANNGNRGNGFQKLVDFSSLASDTGLYDQGGFLNFFNIATAPTATFVPGQAETVLITRDANNLFTGYVNGVQQIQFTDTDNQAVFSSNIIRFFQDDNATSQQESGPGNLTRIDINAPAAAPEPSQFVALGIGILGLGALALKAKRRMA